MDGVRIRLAGAPLRLLGGDAALLEPTQEVSPVEVDAPLAADDLGDAATGPEVGGEAERLRALAEPAEHLALAGRREFALPRRRRFGFHAVNAVVAFGGPPELDGPFGDAEELRDVGNGVAVVKMGEGESPSPFEFGRRAGWSHDR
jgi:hypothetical protein